MKYHLSQHADSILFLNVVEDAIDLLYCEGALLADIFQQKTFMTFSTKLLSSQVLSACNVPGVISPQGQDLTFLLLLNFIKFNINLLISPPC